MTKKSDNNAQFCNDMVSINVLGNISNMSTKNQKLIESDRIQNTSVFEKVPKLRGWFEMYVA